MSDLQFIVTDAGRAAHVNAQNTGTLPITIAKIGVTDQAFTATKATASLPGEIKRLATFAGDSVADDTIHVVIRDTDPVVYSMRGFALYLADGTLYGAYGQPDVIVEKSAQSTMLLAADLIFADIDATEIAFGDTNWLNPPATTTVQGVVELATNAEALAGTDTRRSLVPAALKHVLDQRFGQGAPSSFVKGLLSLGTAALLRVALEIKGAALKDEGAGNGLDADKLDGQHGSYYRAWANLTGVPSSFPPAAHSHPWSQISGPPSTATRWPAWSEVTSRPSTYPPSNHNHSASEINSGTLDAARIPTLAQSKVSGLPAALAEKLNSSAVGITQSGASVGGIGFNDISVSGFYRPTSDGSPQSGADIDVIHIQASNGDASQIAISTGNSIYFRCKDDGETWSDWASIWHSLNFDPESKAPVSHNHSASQITSGTLDVARIPDLDASKIASGKVGVTHLPHISGSEVSGYARLSCFPDNDVAGSLRITTGGANLHYYFNGAAVWSVSQYGNMTVRGNAAVTGTLTAADASLGGEPTAPTPGVSDSSTRIATTAFVKAAIAAALADYLPKHNPTFTGTMTGPAYNKP